MCELNSSGCDFSDVELVQNSFLGTSSETMGLIRGEWPEFVMNVTNPTDDSHAMQLEMVI